VSEEEEPELAPHLIEQARSSRSRCRTCRRKIQKDVLRIGILLEGPYGTGYLWHHLNCAAKRRLEEVEEAYKTESWDSALEVPTIESLRKLEQKATEEKANRREPPWAERAATDRSKCKSCAEPIAKDAWRVVILREVAFGTQVRSGPIKVHAACVAQELQAMDCVTESEGFIDALTSGSADLSPEELAAVLAEVGELQESD